MQDNQTIAAVSTPPGASGIGIVRLSGDKSLKILERIFFPKSAVSAKVRPRLLRLGWICDEDGKRVDQVMAVYMPAPATYTREDVVELHCHGGHQVLTKVLRLTLANGARLAEPGEFTKRAFLNGRIDLAQAEAVIDIINAGSEAGLALCEESLAGGLSQKILNIRTEVEKVTALAEAHIDFPEDELGAFPVKKAIVDLQESAKRCRNLAGTYQEGRLLQEGARTVFLGRPNAGKSSILNRLLQRERAIVTDIPGTTRDALEEYFHVEGVPFHLVDVAGYRQTDDPVEQAGVDIAKEKAKSADMVLLIFDISTQPNSEDENLVQWAKSRVRQEACLLPVLNKVDLTDERRTAQWVEQCKEWELESPVVVSALKGDGFDELLKSLREKALSGKLPAAGEVLVTRLRHKVALEEAATALDAAVEAMKIDTPLDLVAVDLHEALDHLGEIVGIVTTEDLLDRIFGEFCIGK